MGWVEEIKEMQSSFRAAATGAIPIQDEALRHHYCVEMLMSACLLELRKITNPILKLEVK